MADTVTIVMSSSVAVFCIGVVYNAGRQSMRLEKLEEWRHELRDDIERWKTEVRIDFAEIKRLIREGD
jgi:hypothetical protein